MLRVELAGLALLFPCKEHTNAMNQIQPAAQPLINQYRAALAARKVLS